MQGGAYLETQGVEGHRFLNAVAIAQLRNLPHSCFSAPHDPKGPPFVIERIS